MPETRQSNQIKMPEFIVFARVFAIGLVVAEVWRVSFKAGEKFASFLYDIDWSVQAIVIAPSLLVWLAYIIMRDAGSSLIRLGRSYRFDLLFCAILGGYADILLSPFLVKFHKAIIEANPLWTPVILFTLLLALASSVFRAYLENRKTPAPQFYFLGDDAIENEKDDILQINPLAKGFAETVLASGAHSGLVFGIDGPWGTGKTSFINLVEKHWKNDDSVIVFRFEPLRYATDPDLSVRFIRELSKAIQRQVYAPEFSPAVSRYTRMIKGFSILGIRLSFESSNETVDELLEDIDSILKSIRRRVIVVIDDLDRLEAKAVNNVLFTVRRTFKLTQATYILCYDTENLVRGKDDAGNAREFLEKFVTVKLSLMVDSSMLRNFLKTDWKDYERGFPSIPADTMLKLSTVVNALAEMLDGDKASKYMPLIGDMRKLKRFFNALLMMQIEKTDLAKTDFNPLDLVNLLLLHLNYPGLFRRVYAEETEGRTGVFSAKQSHNNGRTIFSNAEGFTKLKENEELVAQFLLQELFDVSQLGIENVDPADEHILSSRACFNSGNYRNLEKFLKLIVRFATPGPRETYKLYQEAVDRVMRGAFIKSILKEPDFDLSEGELAHDQFWRILIKKSNYFSLETAEDAINTLIEYLPRYSSIGTNNIGLFVKRR